MMVFFVCHVEKCKVLVLVSSVCVCVTLPDLLSVLVSPMCDAFSPKLHSNILYSKTMRTMTRSLLATRADAALVMIVKAAINRDPHASLHRT